MSQVPILNGIYADANADFRTAYPRNLIPVPKDQGISKGYLRPADGIQANGTGPGVNRGAIRWNGKLYRVMGTKLVLVDAAGVVTELGDVGGSGPVTMAYGFDRLAIASNGSLFYWNGATLTSVTDANLGICLDVHWFGGYFVSTDGANIVVTELTDPTTVNPLKYGSAEANPDPILAIDDLRNELLALGRYTIEAFQNIGGDLFPFQRINGALVPKGVIGTHAYCNIGSTLAFMGSGQGEAPAVYLMAPGDTQKISTREIDQILLDYTEAQLSQVVAEVRVDKNHQFIYFHLPDQCLVYDTMASAATQEPVWFTLTSSIVGLAAYRARGLVWAYDQWNVGDPTSSALGVLTDAVSDHYGQAIGWEFGTVIEYNEGNDAQIHELELVCLTGRVSATTDPVIWTSYSHDGQTWSQEHATKAGRQGKRMQRVCWRGQGTIRNLRMQKFRGTSDAFLSMARLEVAFEALHTRPGNG
jgi:hypothetical protein